MDEHFDQRCREAGIDPASFLGGRLMHLVLELVGFPRHLGQHVGDRFAEALIEAAVPLPLHPLPGVTVPPVPWLIVR